jgi:hypothetical protein
VPGYLATVSDQSFSLLLLFPFLPFFTLARTAIHDHPKILLAAGAMFLIATANGASTALAIKEPLFLSFFVFAATLFRTIGAHSPTMLKGAAKTLCFMTVAAAISVLLFRFATQTELSYINSSLADLFISPTVLKERLMSNSIEPDKAGGLLYFNANQAAALLFCAFSLTMVALHGTWRVIVALIMLSAMLAAGSKTTYSLALTMPLLVVWVMTTRNLPVLLKLSLAALAACTLLLVVYVTGLLSWIINFDTFQIRLELWKLALSHLHEYFLFGADPDFWPTIWNFEGRFGLFARETVVHNYVLRLLMLSGIVPLILLFWGWSDYVRRPSHVNSLRNHGWFAVALLWVLGHALMENLSLFGDLRISIMLSFLYAYAHLPEPQLKERGDHILRPGISSQPVPRYV